MAVSDISHVQDAGHVPKGEAYDHAVRRVVLLGVVVLLAAGCTDARQRAAARAVERSAGRQARCTKSARMLGGTPVNTSVFICNVKRGDALCDRYSSTLAGKSFVVKLQARRVDCVLPPS
jgi:hypothetical protein